MVTEPETGLIPRTRPTPSLAASLFVPTERWGWEYLDVAPARVDAGPEPQWVEPPPPSDVMNDLADQQTQARARMTSRIGITAGVALLLLFMDGGLALLAMLAGGAWTAAPIMLPARRMKLEYDAWQAHCAAEYAAFQAHLQQRHAWIAARHRDEQMRIAAAPRFQHVTLQSATTQVDVFGDTTDGWASLLTTAGSSLLRSGTPVVLLDLTGEHVGTDLIGMAAAAGIDTADVELPRRAADFRLLEDLTPDEVAELVAEVARGPWPKGEDLRGLHADLLRTVTERLDAPVTARRLAAGLRTLRRVHSPDHDDVLTDIEFARIRNHVDSAGQTERVQSELHALTTVVDGLVSNAATGTAHRWRHLSVVSTDADRRRKKHLDRLAFHRVLHDLASGQLCRGTVLMVAGSDSLDLESLESMARQSRRGGVRLVLFMEKLRDELTHLVGRSGSATIFMRLGNADEARVAAEHVGRGHKLVLSALTSQIGDSFTQGSAESAGTQDGESRRTSTTVSTTTSTENSSGVSRERHRDRFGIPMGNAGTRTLHHGSAHGSSASRSRSESVSSSRSKTWAATSSYTDEVSRSTSDTYARTYDFHTEPTCFQNLAPTAFVLVEPGASGRRVVMGDCNPGISLLDGNAPA
jgi:hypothetical protein